MKITYILCVFDSLSPPHADLKERVSKEVFDAVNEKMEV